MSKPIAIYQIQQIHALLPAHIKADKEEKKALIMQFTGSKERTSTKDLNFYQAHALICSLQGKEVGYEQYAYFDASKKQHLYILSLCRQLGWVKYSEKTQTNIADLNKLGHWLIHHGVEHKPLKEYTSQSLTKIIYQLEQMLAKKK